jgi:hypothetical protein
VTSERYALGLNDPAGRLGIGLHPSAPPQNGQRRREVADRLACEAWNLRMLGFQGPAQPSPALGDALNAGFLYLEVKCLGCGTHQTVL